MELTAKSLSPDSHYSMDYYCLLQSWKHPRLGQTSWGKGCRVDLMASQWVRTRIHILSLSLSPSLTASPSKDTWALGVWQTVAERSDCTIIALPLWQCAGMRQDKETLFSESSKRTQGHCGCACLVKGLRKCVLETSLPCLPDPEADHS